MKTSLKLKPREYGVGEITIRDYGKIELEAWEMISLTSKRGRKCDITGTDWGFYLGSSLNDRMRREGFKVCIVKNQSGKIFINAVEEGCVDGFTKYLAEQGSTILMWLDEMS